MVPGAQVISGDFCQLWRSRPLPEVIFLDIPWLHCRCFFSETIKTVKSVDVIIVYYMILYDYLMYIFSVYLYIYLYDLIRICIYTYGILNPLLFGLKSKKPVFQRF